MAKEVKAKIKMRIPGGGATPAYTEKGSIFYQIDLEPHVLG